MSAMSFADSVRSIARLKPLIVSGVLGAAVACSLSTGALAADSPNAERDVSVLGAEADMHKVSAEFYTKGALIIAQTDFSKMSPRDAVSTIKSMARATIEAGPEISNFASADPAILRDGDARVTEAVARTSNAYNGASMVRAFVERLTREPVLSAGAVSEEARGTVKVALGHLKAAGIEIQPGAKAFEGVEAEMKQAVGTKLDALKKIAALGDDPDADPIDAVEAALGGQAEMQPALRVLLGRLAADAINDPDVPVDTKADLIKGIAIRQAADGAFDSIVRQAREDGTDVDTKRMAMTATVALGSIAHMQKEEPEVAMAPR